VLPESGQCRIGDPLLARLAGRFGCRNRNGYLRRGLRLSSFAVESHEFFGPTRRGTFGSVTWLRAQVSCIGCSGGVDERALAVSFVARFL
jgi:hypothetical protein